MAHKKFKRPVVVGAAALIVVVSLVVTVLLINAAQPKEDDPYRQTDTSRTDSNNDDGLPADDQNNTSADQTGRADEEGAADTNDTVAIDPSTVATIDIEPMEITVSYIRGIDGFMFEVLRMPNGTKYVEFRNEGLVGTKCTNDQGTFASILANPQGAESSTLTKTVKVGENSYGLSLADETCTSDVDTLRQYQKSFSDAFGLLERME